MILENKKGSVFVNVIATIGAVLIFVGIAWLIAKNWHQIPNAIKVLILVFATLASFVSGVLLRQYEHEGVGRSLITLGALLYILSLFLISQIYHLATTEQHYAWLLFFSWTVILATAYLLDSPENVVVSMLAFFPWVILQYVASISKLSLSSFESHLIGFVFIFLSAGALLFGLSALHKSLNHKFASKYRFWTVFYFLLVFYILSFQLFVSILSGYSFSEGAFSFFLVFFIIVCLFGFIFGVLSARKKKAISSKEIFGFIGILALLLILVLSTKIGAREMGSCHVRSCREFETPSACNSAPSPLTCKWASRAGCIEVRGKEVPFETCGKYYNQKNKCISNPACYWQPAAGSRFGFSIFGGPGSLPTSLWLLWILNNFVFIGFIVLVLWYGQNVGSTKIVNLGLVAFILEIITRYIGFWFGFRGYFAFSVLAILGGLMLILGAWLIPKWRKKLLDKTKQAQQPTQQQRVVK